MERKTILQSWKAVTASVVHHRQVIVVLSSEVWDKLKKVMIKESHFIRTQQACNKTT